MDQLRPGARRGRVLLAGLTGFIAGAVAAVAAPAWVAPPGFTATRGGEGGRIVEVTTLAAAGPGSFAAALAAAGPRTITFAVGGVIDLAGATLHIRSPRVTVAGETAPGPGITLIRGGLGLATHDVILRHLRVRPGEAGRAKKSGWDIDGVATGDVARDIVVDHCSISWATDENLSASGGRFGGDTPPLWPANFRALPAAQVTDAVLADVGARPSDRDAVDRRLVEEARTGGGRIIDSEDEVGGYAILGATALAPVPPAPRARRK